MCHSKKHSMRQYLYSIVLILFSITSFGQTLFFEKLNTTTWTSTSISSELNLINSTRISLSELRFSKDLIKQNVSIWTFRDSTLTIMNYNYLKKSDSLVGRYNFKSIYDKAILQIQFNDATQIKYEIGITSTGSYASLYRLSDNNAKFITKIDIQSATKDGIYLNGYIVNIPYEKLKKLNGKTVRISGKVTLLKANNISSEGKIQQGRANDTKHILNPKIKIIEK